MQLHLSTMTLQPPNSVSLFSQQYHEAGSGSETEVGAKNRSGGGNTIKMNHAIEIGGA